jgi:hypothetical protein
MSRKGGHSLRSPFMILTNSHSVPVQKIALRTESIQYTIGDDFTYDFSSICDSFTCNANTSNPTFSFALTSRSMSEGIRKDFLTSTRLFRMHKLEIVKIADETDQTENRTNAPKDRFLQEIVNKLRDYLLV